MLGPTTSPDAVKQPVQRFLSNGRCLGRRCCLLLWNGWRLLGFGPAYGSSSTAESSLVSSSSSGILKFDEEEGPCSEKNEDGQHDENDAHDAGTTVVAAGDGDRKLSVLGLSGELEDLTVHFEDDLEEPSMPLSCQR